MVGTSLVVTAVLLLGLTADGGAHDANAAAQDAKALQEKDAKAERLVHWAVEFLKKEGKAKALATFSDPKGPFSVGDQYVMVYDFDGRCLAHGADANRVGKVLLDDKDVNGKLFIRERLQIAKEQGKGWQTYHFRNPMTNTVEEKRTYFERTGDLVVSSGVYRRSLGPRAK